MTMPPAATEQYDISAVRAWFLRELTKLKQRQRTIMRAYDERKKNIVRRRLSSAPQDESYANRSEE